jgi:hypothetical protein
MTKMHVAECAEDEVGAGSFPVGSKRASEDEGDRRVSQ